MKKNMNYKSLFLGISLMAGLFVSTLGAEAHNQSPATIKRSMEKAFKSLEAIPPSNLITGKQTLRVAGGTAQIFEAKSNGTIVGYVAQIEFQEELYAIAVNATSKQVTSVVRAGTTLQESEWKELSFVEAIRKALVETPSK